MAEAVLVTRPRGQADVLVGQLRRAGYEVVHQPMLEIHEHSGLTPAQRQQILNLDRYQHLVFVSANAVRTGMTWFEQFWPQLPAAQHYYAMGDNSAKLLAGYGVNVIKPAHMDSEALLELDQLQSVEHDKVLLIGGEGGRTVIASRLTERGAKVERLELYKRGLPEVSAAELQALFSRYQFAAVLISSGEGLTNLIALLGEKCNEVLAGSALIVPGQRVGELAVSHGIQPIITAKNATDQAMLLALSGRSS